MEYTIIAFEGKKRKRKLNYGTSLSSINLFITTICTITVTSFRPLAFELKVKEICSKPTSLIPPNTVSRKFCLFWFPTLALYALQQSFKGQKWNRGIDLSWSDTTLIFTYYSQNNIKFSGLFEIVC